jgi:hypothetical protein
VAPAVSADSFFRGLQQFVELHGANELFSGQEEARQGQVVGEDEDDVLDSVISLLELPHTEGMMRVLEEKDELCTKREQRVAQCQGIGVGRLKDFFKERMQLMQRHAREEPPQPEDDEDFTAMLEEVQDLSMDHSEETVEAACQLLQNINENLCDTDNGGVLTQCLNVYKEFSDLVKTLADWDLFEYDRRGDEWSARYDTANTQVERLADNMINRTLIAQEVQQCQADARELGVLLQDYADKWKELDRCVHQPFCVRVLDLL